MKHTHYLLLGTPLLFLHSAFAQNTYNFTSIDYQESSTTLTGINSRGDVVGFASISLKGGKQETQAFVRQASGVFEKLPGTGPNALPEPYGISDSETVVGFYNSDGVIYKEHTFQLFSLGARQTELTGISTNGLMVGNQFGTTVSYAFQLNGGKIEPLPTLYGKPVQANAINSTGTIAGTVLTETGESVNGFLLAPKGSYQTFAYPGATNTYFSAINNSGVVAGYWVTGSVAQSFVYSNGQFINIQFPGAASTQAFGVNERGVVSGTYLDAGPANHGFIATPEN